MSGKKIKVNDAQAGFNLLGRLKEESGSSGWRKPYEKSCMGGSSMFDGLP